MFWQQLLDHLDGGEPAFLAIVADNTAHSPGTRGARLFVRPDGTTEGTIGGGVMEADLIERGLEALDADAFEPSFETLYHRNKGKGKKSGLGCAGHQTNVYFVCRPGRDREVLEEVVRRREQDLAGVLAIDGDGMRLEEADIIGRERPPVRLVDSDDGWRFEEQLLNWKRAAILGGGHCGLALSRVLDGLGYTVTNFDTRPDVFTFRQNEHARHKIAVDDYAEAGEHIRHPRLTHVIVMTYNKDNDVRGLLGTVEGPYPYIGVMGSPAKQAMIRRDLLAEGIDEEHIDRLYAPIGVEMTSNTPEEIAISISAELLQLREELFPHARPSRPSPPE